MYANTFRLIASLPDRRPSDTMPTRLAMLFDRLGRGEGDVMAIEDAIWTIWMYHPHSRAAEALDRAVSDIAAQRYDIAETRLALLLRARPDFSEAWHKRATLHYMREDDAESVRDLHRTLELEPRHFPALLSFGEICLTQRKREGAELAFRTALKIHPRLDAARTGLERAAELEL
jgi:tetratricopeptide (TPR) repeat protein